jgi:hypothetical protein
MAETRTGSTVDWTTEEVYSRNNYKTRPYIGTNQDFTYWSPGYRYGYDSAVKYRGKTWNEVEADLRNAWDRVEYRGQRTWDQIKDAVRDGWNRVTGNR